MDGSSAAAAAIQSVGVDEIRTSDSGPQRARRKRFDKGHLAELAESIRVHGVLQPIIVRTRENVRGPKYELVAGERRWMAARDAGLKEVPAVVRRLTDEQVLEVQLIENLQREDLHPMQEAEGYHELMKKHGHPVEELHERVGKSRSYVYGRLKLLALCKEVRAGFYDGTINASIALLLARIPIEELQREALSQILDGWDGPMSYREARDLVQDHYMLRLAEASFPTDDAELVAAAGPCGSCPKRTGNQPELFSDVSSADVCTDPECFAAKVRAHGDRLIAEASERGQPTITGAAAERLAKRGVRNSLAGGTYRKLDETEYRDPKIRKVKQLVGQSAERTLLQDPNTGAVIEIVKASDVDEALREKVGKAAIERPTNDQRARERKAKLERTFRAALYQELRPKLGTPPLQTVAIALWREMQHETCKTVARLWGWEPPKSSWGGQDYHRGLEGKIRELTDEELGALLNDCIHADELQVSTWSNAKAEKLLAAAKEHGIDAAALRRQLAKKPAKKKATKKKTLAKRKESA